MKLRLFKIIFFVLVGFSSTAQNHKYRSIIPLLSASDLIDITLNFGGSGGAPTEVGFYNVWGQPFNSGDLFEDIDFGTIGGIVGVRCLNDSYPDTWGETAGSAVNSLGAGSTIYQHNWFVSDDRIGVLELSGLPAGTYTIQCSGSRGSITGPRTSHYTIGATSYTLNVANNTSNYVEFTGVTPSSGIIILEVRETTPQDASFGYLAWVRIIQID